MTRHAPRQDAARSIAIRRRIAAWSVFAMTSAAGVVALTWATIATIRIERDELKARAENEQAQVVRLALWRMDSWMTPRLAAEATRPYFHYLALYPSRRTYSQFMVPIAPDEALMISPLMEFTDEIIPLHVQVDAAGTITSPQAPEDDAGLVAAAALAPERITAARQALSDARRQLSGLALVERVGLAISCQTEVLESAEAELLANDIWIQAPPPGGVFGDAAPSMQSGLAAESRGDALAARSPATTRSNDRDPAPRSDAAVPAPAAPPMQKRGAPMDEGDYAKRVVTSNRAQTVQPVQSFQMRQTADPLQISPRGGGAPGGFGGRAEGADDLLIERDGAGLERGPAAGVAFIERAVEVGPFAPLWIESDGVRTLWYFRTVRVGENSLAQGFAIAWPELCSALRAQIVDLLPSAQLLPGGAVGTDDREGSTPGVTGAARLASVPALLLPGERPEIEDPGMTPARAALGTAWLGILAAIAAAGFTLRAVRADADRRARFAGVVTHELRTPLTTFQLYTEMLADDMVPAERRGEYLDTLRTESHRLGNLVENVLSYARVEQGRHAPQRETIDAAALIERVLPALSSRARDAGRELVVEIGWDEVPGVIGAAMPAEDGVSMWSSGLAHGRGSDRPAARSWPVDIGSVERILVNLVDNAGRYGSIDPAPAGAAALVPAGAAQDLVAGTEEDPIVLRVVEDEGHLDLLIIDHGPGIPPAMASRLFRPFERGDDDRTRAVRGIGLGLALSRELARAMGGDLSHEPTPGGGATFRLRL